MVRFGIEEEFMTLGRQSLAPVAKGAAAWEALVRRDAVSSQSQSQSQSQAQPNPRNASSEFLDCQVEVSTTPVETLEQARRELSAHRRRLHAFAEDDGAIVAGVGTPFGATRGAVITPLPRYAVIAESMGAIRDEHFVNGLHVHAEVRDVEDRVRALNAVRPWLPLLLALSTDSPFWQGGESGFSSWRSIHLRRLSTMWCPPWFQDVTDYHARIDRVIRLGAAVDRASISWAARLSEAYPTVEVRVFDAQLCVEDTLLMAALVRSTIAEPPNTVFLDAEATDAALWVAAREGVGGRLIDPLSGEIATVWEVASRLRDAIGNGLATHGDADFVERRIALLRERGTGAERQRRALQHDGPPGLARLLASSLTADC